MYKPLHLGLTHRLAIFRYEYRFLGNSSWLYCTFEHLICRPASSSNDGGSKVMFCTNPTTNGLFRKLSSSKSRDTICGGSVDKRLL